MSGDGVVSARVPRSLLAILRAVAAEHGISIHEAAARLLDRLPSLTLEELASLPEPPREPDNPRISLHIGWNCVDILTEITYGSPLNNSSIIRRVLYAYLVQNTLEFVQRGGRSVLQLISQNEDEKIHENGDGHAAR
jgi:hypothetical protein